MSEVEATGLKTKEVPHNDDKTNGEHATLHYPHSNKNNNTNSTMTTTTTRKQRLEAMSTIGMKGQRTIDAFYDVMWPILEKEGGWTLVRGTGNEEGLVIFCPPVTATAVEKKGGGGTEQVTTASVLPENLDMVQISTNLLLLRDKHNNNNNDKNDDDDDANSHQTPPQQPKQRQQPYSRNNNNNNNNNNNKNTTIPELLHQQGPWTCICGNTNEEGTIRCEQCYGWRESFSTTTNTTITTTVNTTNNGNKKVACPLQEYYTNIRQIIEYILQNHHNTTTNNPTTSSSSLASSSKDVYIKASKAYIGVITNAMELFGESSSSSNNHNNNNNRYDDDDDDDDDDDMNNNKNNHHHQQQQQHHHHHIPMSPNTRMTRQRFSDIAWKENRTHYEKNSSRIGKEYQVDVLPEVGSYYYHGDNNNNQKKKTTKDKDKRNMMEEEEEEEEVLYDQVWDSEKAQKSGKIDFIHHRVKSSIKEPAYDMLHQRNYQLPGFYDELLSKANPTDCSHWTSEERAKFRKLVFEKHEDMWQISEALGRPVRECVTYYLGKFKTSKDFRSLRRVMEKARDENPFKYPGEILCDKCGKGGKLVYCDSCDSHYHLMCQDPPLLEVPEGNDWKCNKCVESKVDEEEEKEEDTSNGVEVDTSNYCEEEEAEVSSFEGKRSDIIDSDEKKKEAAVAAAAKPANDNNDVNATNDAMSYSSVSAGGGVGEGEGKRPHNGEIPTDNVPTPSAKKAKSSNAASNHNFEEEEETSMTSFVSDEVSGVDSEMVSRSQHHHHHQQQQQLQQQPKEQPPLAADTNEKAP